MRAALITSNAQSIFYEFPFGKPNPKEPFVGTPDNRTRVDQAKSKGECTYYAFNYLRDRIGPVHSEEYSRARAIEKTISCWRKSSQKVGALETLLRLSPEQSCQENIRIATTCLESLGFNKAHLMLNIVERVTKVMIQNGFSFLNESLLKEWNDYPSDREVLQQTIQMMFSSLPPELQSSGLDRLVPSAMVEAYGLELSPWTPKVSFNELLKILHDKGPMAVGGELGWCFYEAPPLPSARTVEGRPVFYFPKGAERKAQTAYHVVIIVGAAKIEKQELVYFIDPNDGSDVKIGQPVYMISYSNLIKSVPQSIIYPLITEDKSTGNLVLTAEAYGVHSSKVTDSYNKSSEAQLVEKISKLELSK